MAIAINAEFERIRGQEALYRVSDFRISDSALKTADTWIRAAIKGRAYKMERLVRKNDSSGVVAQRVDDLELEMPYINGWGTRPLRVLATDFYNQIARVWPGAKSITNDTPGLLTFAAIAQMVPDYWRAQTKVWQLPTSRGIYLVGDSLGIGERWTLQRTLSEQGRKV